MRRGSWGRSRRQSADRLLERSRRWKGQSKGPNDILTVFEQELDLGLGTGRVARELRYGGDTAPLSTADTCTLDPGQAQSRLEHTYEHGALKTSSYVDPQAPSEVVLEVVDHDIDLDTGRVTTSRDPAGVATDFVYDNMGRLIREQPEESAWTIYTYDLPAPGSSTNPELTQQQCPNGSMSCTPLSWRKATYDGLGRQTIEWIEYAQGSGPTLARRDFQWTSNDVVEIIDAPAKRFQSPDRIRTTGVAAGEDWSTGFCRYDGSGNSKRSAAASSGTTGSAG